MEDPADQEDQELEVTTEERLMQQLHQVQLEALEALEAWGVWEWVLKDDSLCMDLV